MKNKKDYTISSVQRALEVLKIFDGPVTRFTLTQLSEMSGIGKSSMLRILYTLCESGFLTFDEDTNEYSLSVLLYRLGMAKQNSINVQRVSLHYLRQLCEQTEMICYLGIRQDDQLLMIEQVLPSSIPIWAQLMVRRGGMSELYSTGIGRLLLSQESDEAIRRYLKRIEIKQLTPDTITDTGEIMELIHKAGRDDFDKDQGANNIYIGSMCAPILDYSGKIVAGISLCGMRDMLNSGKADEYEHLVKKAAADISHDLGYKPA